MATAFQTRSWCEAWYRSYQDVFEAVVLVLHVGRQCVAIVPLASAVSNGRLTLVGDNLADYPDVLALPDYHERAVEELLRFYATSGVKHPFHLGWTIPESPTTATARRLLGRVGLNALYREDPAWRWSGPAKKRSIRHWNYYQKQGSVTVERLTAERWLKFRDSYFHQHSLRQLAAGRPVSFHDPRKRAFFDALINASPAPVHIAALILEKNQAEQMLAAHYGYFWGGTVYFGAPVFDLNEEHQSPALILMQYLVQHAEQFEMTCLDLTIGDSDFKRRLGTTLVQLPKLVVYSDRTAFYLAKARLQMARLVKKWGGGRWLERFKRGSQRSSDTPVAPGVWTVDSNVQVSGFQVGRNCLADFLLHLDESPVLDDSGVRAYERILTLYPDHVRLGGSVLTAIGNCRLAGWAAASMIQKGEEKYWQISDLDVVGNNDATQTVRALLKTLLAEEPLPLISCSARVDKYLRASGAVRVRDFSTSS